MVRPPLLIGGGEETKNSTAVVKLVLNEINRANLDRRSYIIAIGGNEQAAFLCGVNIAATRITVYTMAGFTVGMAGLFQFARLSSANPTSGTGKELLVIASVIIGGGSLTGGRGSILGTLTGALIMQVISSGCTALRLPDPIREIIVGTIIVVAVALDQLRQRRLVTSKGPP